MTEKERKVEKLGKNYRKLDGEGRETFLKIGEKINTVNDFVNKEVESMKEDEDESTDRK